MPELLLAPQAEALTSARTTGMASQPLVYVRMCGWQQLLINQSMAKLHQLLLACTGQPVKPLLLGRPSTAH